MNDGQLKRLQYKYNTLRIIAIGLLFITFYFCFITVILVGQKQDWRKVANERQSDLMECIRKPLK